MMYLNGLEFWPHFSSDTVQIINRN